MLNTRPYTHTDTLSADQIVYLSTEHAQSRRGAENEAVATLAAVTTPRPFNKGGVDDW